jgi:hypothetical protein
MTKLKGRRVGVIGGDANSKIVDVLSKEFGLDRTKVFKDIALPDARRALQSKEVNALLIVIPLAEKYLSLVRGLFPQNAKAPRLRVTRSEPSCRYTLAGDHSPAKNPSSSPRWVTSQAAMRAELKLRVQEALKHLPDTGERFKHDGWLFEIVDMDGRKIDKLIASRAKTRQREARAESVG